MRRQYELTLQRVQRLRLAQIVHLAQVTDVGHLKVVRAVLDLAPQ